MKDKKVIWITGASSGIGKALSLKFANEGWIVAASARRENLLKELNEIKKVDYSSSEMIIKRAVSIPIGLSLDSKTPKLIRDSIIKAYNSLQNA